MNSLEDIFSSIIHTSFSNNEYGRLEEVMASHGARVPSELMVSATSSFLQSDIFSSDEDEEDHVRNTGNRLTHGLQLEELIGRGAFGSVHKAVWKGLPAAVKVCQASSTFSQDQPCTIFL
jgi:hypothetical protein